MALPDSNILILGLGREGETTLEYLIQKKIKNIAIADSKLLRELSVTAKEIIETEDIKCFLGPSYLDAIKEYNYIIKSPGISPLLPQLQDAYEEGKTITSATNIFFEEKKGKVIGVTATKGEKHNSITAILHF